MEKKLSRTKSILNDNLEKQPLLKKKIEQEINWFGSNDFFSFVLKKQEYIRNIK